MAVDAALLSEVSEGRQSLPLIRLYQWDRPSVSIGRLQPEPPVRRLYPDLPCVRRPTGGRAVVHGADLTITAAARTDWFPDDAGRTILSSYRLLMAGLVTALAEAGHETRFGAEKAHGGRGSLHCFDLAVGCDLVDARSGQKLVGSAQRREGDALLQQMSLPLALLPDLSAFLRSLRQGFGQALGVEEWLFIDTAAVICHTEN
jgi:lipoate-protein ligase A